MRAIAAASVLTAILALAGCAGASPPAPYRTPAAQATPTYATPPPPLVPDTKADREACQEFSDVLTGKIPKARFADWTGNHDVRGKLLTPIAAWLAGAAGSGPVMTDCETLGAL